MFNRLVNRGPLSLLLFVLPTLLFLQLRLPAYVQAQSQTTSDEKINLSRGQKTPTLDTPLDLSKKNVLLLHAYTYETASSLIMDPIFVKGFTDSGLGAFNLHFEFMASGAQYHHEWFGSHVWDCP